MECLKIGIGPMIMNIYLSSRNELEPDVLVRFVDELCVEPHVAVVVLQAVALQHLDGEHVALQLREPPPDTHARSLRR